MGGRYAVVVRTPGAVRMIGFGFLARLPDGMLNLAILLAVARTTSLAVGGIAAGAYSAANALGSPLRGRWLDRRGATVVVVTTGLGQAALLLGLTAAVHAGSRPVIVVIAAAAGLVGPPLVAAVRGAWTRTLSGEAAQTAASAMESVIGETVYLSGTVLAGSLGGAAPPVVVLLVTVALRAVGCIGLAGSPLIRQWLPRERASAGRDTALASRTVRVVLTANVLAFASFGCVDVAVTHFTRVRDDTGYVGVLLAGYAIGSILGGAFQGTRDWRPPLGRQQVVLLGLVAALLIPADLATTTPMLFAVLLVAGLPVAPSATVGFLLVGREAPPGVDAEAYTWLTAAAFVGLAIGTSVGATAGHAFTLAVILAAAAAVAGTPLLRR
jgi:predicted MFS family arabinose efflux permease